MPTYRTTWPFTRWEHAECTCCSPRQPIRRAWFKNGNEEWMHDEDEEFALTLHAHVDVGGRDCDGDRGHSYTMLPSGLNDTSIGIGQFDFYSEALVLVLPTHLNEYGSTIQIDGDGAHWSCSTDEGHSSGEIRFCSDPDCADKRDSQYDQFAELAGY